MALTEAPKPGPVRLELYMEALCPFCGRFLTHEVGSMFEQGLDAITDLSVIPWGNARVVNGTVQCQHGATECYMNEVLSCAMDQHPAQAQWFRFMNCTEGSKPSKIEQQAQDCAAQLDWSWHDIEKCTQGHEVSALQEEAQHRTESLRPPHQYVPWVVVNGVPLLDDYANAARYVCAAYTGDDRPEACYSLTQLTSSSAAAARWDALRQRAHSGAILLLALLLGALLVKYCCTVVVKRLQGSAGACRRGSAGKCARGACRC